MNKEKAFQDLLNSDLSQVVAQDSTAMEEIEIDPKESMYKKGLDYAIRILSLRDYSEYKMRTKLKERKIPKIDADKIIEKLLDLNYLREEEYTRQRIKQLIMKGYANSYILQKLEQEHLQCSTAKIDEIREENELDSDSRLNYLIEKKLRYKEIPTEFEPKMKLKQKITSFLVSKGYNFSEINNALSNYIK